MQGQLATKPGDCAGLSSSEDGIEVSTMVESFGGGRVREDTEKANLPSLGQGEDS